MMNKPETSKDRTDKLVKTFHRKARQTYSAEEKIRIVLAGLRGEENRVHLPQDHCPLMVCRANHCRKTAGGWYYLSTIWDDCSRYTIGWKLCTNVKAEAVTETIEAALTASGCDKAIVRHKPRLLSDNGSFYILGDLAQWQEGQKMVHIRGARECHELCVIGPDHAGFIYGHAFKRRRKCS